MSENILKIQEVMKELVATQQNRLLISFDFEKAFDMVEFEVIIYSQLW